jgi:pimeloyl-ACP methyl ester carboxylesterase
MIEPGRAAVTPPLPPLHLTLIGAAAYLVPLRPGAVRAAVRRAPRGDGHPVLVLPSFLRGDRHTRALRQFLVGCGYAVHGWELGANLGPTAAVLDGVARRLTEISARQGRKISLIGHSLGGVIARELAKERQSEVRQLITLASPIHLPTASPLFPVYDLLSRWQRVAPQGSIEELNRPPEVPVTAIFTRSDGIVAWQSCCEAPGPRRESIELRGSHGTLVRNPAAWRVIADRLAQPDGGWRPYSRP